MYKCKQIHYLQTTTLLVEKMSTRAWIHMEDVYNELERDNFLTAGLI